jgi:MFS family permease
MRTLKLLALKDEALQDIVIELEVLIERVYQKIARKKRKLNQRLLLFAIAYFAIVLAVGVGITLLHLIVSFEDLQTWLAGAIGLVGLVVGAVAFGFWGAVGGAIIGGLLGYAMVFLLTNPIGNVLFILLWLTIFGLLYQRKLVSKFKRRTEGV